MFVLPASTLPVPQMAYRYAYGSRHAHPGSGEQQEGPSAQLDLHTGSWGVTIRSRQCVTRERTRGPGNNRRPATDVTHLVGWP